MPPDRSPELQAPRRILLVRHGHRVDEGELRSLGLGLPPLSALGRRQAAAFAQGLPSPPDLIVVSSFVRAIQTAEPLRERFPSVPVETWPVEEFTFLPPALFVGTTIAEREPQNAAYWRSCDPDLHPGPGGESFREFITRIDAVLARLRTRRERFILIVSHGYTIQGILWRIHEPGRSVDAAALHAWCVFRASCALEPTASVELLGGESGPLVAGPLRPAPLPLEPHPTAIRA